jgi:hypothetical protein
VAMVAGLEERGVELARVEESKCSSCAGGIHPNSQLCCGLGHDGHQTGDG